MSERPPEADDARRPRDLAVLLMATLAVPRARARDQAADRVGIELRRELLQGIIELDPDVPELEEALDALVRRHEGAEGPARAVASTILADWQMAMGSDDFWTWLVFEAISGATSRPKRRGGDAPA